MPEEANLSEEDILENFLYEKNARFQRGLKKAKEKLSAVSKELPEGAEDIVQMEKMDKPSNIPFYIVLALAIIKDVIDIAEVTVIGILVTKIITILISIILFFYAFGKISRWSGWAARGIRKGGRAAKMAGKTKVSAGANNVLNKIGLKNWAYKRVAGTVLAEIIPWLAFIPAASLCVVMVHNRDKKLVKVINAAIDEFHSVFEGGGFVHEYELVKGVYRKEGGAISTYLKNSKNAAYLKERLSGALDERGKGNKKSDKGKSAKEIRAEEILGEGTKFEDSSDPLVKGLEGEYGAYPNENKKVA